MAARIQRDPEAFSLQPTGKNSGPVKDKSYLDFIRELPCLVTGTWPVEAAHISYAEPKYGKLGRGKGQKESDSWAVPLSASEHKRQHSMNEQLYWRLAGIDPCIIALSLFAAYPDVDRARLIIRSIRAKEAE